MKCPDIKAKTITQIENGDWAKVSAKKATTYSVIEAGFGDLEGLLGLLEVLLAQPTSFVVRGGLERQVEPGEHITRRHSENYPEDNRAVLIEAERCWVPVDFDGVPMGDDYDLVDVDSMIKGAIKRYLPEPFHNADVVWALSAGAGTKTDGTLNCHLFFMSDRPVGTIWLREYMKAFAPDADTAIYKFGQPIYTAAPIVINGDDPVLTRLGIIQKSADHITLPDVTFDEIEEHAVREGIGLLSHAKGFEAKLALMGHGDGLCGYHAPIREAAASYVSGKLESEIDIPALIERIKEAVTAAPKDRAPIYYKIYSRVSYLKQQIKSAMTKFCRKPVKEVEAFYPLTEGSISSAELEVEEFLERFSADVAEYWRERQATEAENERREAEKDYPLLLSDPVPERLLLTSTGTGKSRAARGIIPELLQETPGKTVGIAVPMHMLAAEYRDELLRPLEDAGFTVGDFRGRGADDLSAPTGESDPKKAYEKMCPLHKEASELAAAGGNIDTQMCAKGRMGTKTRKECQHYQTCGYQRQKDKSNDVTLFAHQLLTGQKPKVLGDLAAVIIDEDPLGTFLAGVGPTSVSTSTDDIQAVESRLKRLAGAAKKKREKKKINGLDAARFAVADVRKTLAVMEDGTINRRALGRALFKTTRSGTMTEKLGSAHRGVWMALKDVGIKPGMEPKRRDAKIAAVAGFNKKVRSVARFIKILQDFLERDGEQNLVEVYTDDDLRSHWERAEIRKAKNNLGSAPHEPPLTDAEKEVERGRLGLGDTSIIPGLRKDDDQIRLSWIKEKRKGWNVPTIYMDATGREEVYRGLFPNIGFNDVCKVECESPHMHVRQVVDWNASRNKLVAHDDRSDKLNKTAVNNTQKVARIIEARATQFRDQGALIEGLSVDVLVVTYKPTRDALEKIQGQGFIPGNVEFAHYGNLTGLDRWKGVRCVILVGGATKGVLAIEHIAELLKGDKLDPLNSAFGSWYAQEKVGGRRRGESTGPELTRNFHNDPIAEAVRWQLTEGTLIQAIGRGREVRRTTDNPLQVDLITDTPLPIEVDEFVSWLEIQPTYLDTLAARGVMIDAETTARGYWSIAAAVLGSEAEKVRESARRALTRGFAYNISYISKNPREQTKPNSGGAANLPSWGHAVVRVGRYGVPVRFAPGADMTRLFGPEARIEVTNPPLILVP